MRLHWLLPDVPGIPVLMYHRIWPGQSDGLTLTPAQLREQWGYLEGQGYEALSLPRFLAIVRGEAPVPPKAVLLTFDDGYHNNLTYVYPLLQELGWCATIFIIADTLDGTAAPVAEEIDRKLRPEELLGMDPRYVQLGMHGYHHENFSETAPEEIREAMRKSMAAFERAGLLYERVLAYPYGARPKDPQVLAALKGWMKGEGVQAAFRIGNKPERVPSKDLFEIRRIDIRGEDSLADFKIKLRKGKLKPF